MREEQRGLAQPVQGKLRMKHGLSGLSCGTHSENPEDSQKDS